MGVLLAGGTTLVQVLPSAPMGDAQQLQATIRVGEDRLLSPGDAQFPVAEPHLSAHPTDPQQLFVSALVIKAAISRTYYDMDCALSASTDGGTRWSRTDLGFGICGNTWSTVLADGSALFVALTEPAGIVQYRANMRVYRSDDGGSTWSAPPHDFGPGFDYPKIVREPVHGDLYVVGARAVRRADGRIRSSIVVARSTDAGRGFPDSVHLTASENIYEAQVPATLSNGTLLVPFTEHHDGTGKALPARRCWLLVSRDRGRTFSAPRLIAEGGCGGGTGWPYLAADGTRGPYRDRLYWLAAREGLPGVWLRHSDDVGASWSPWVRVDQEVEPASAVAYALVVNRAGAVGVMWLSSTESPEPCSRVFFSASVDGGDSFLRPVRVSTERSCPARDPRNAAAYTHRPRAGGDYNGLAAAADGSFHLVWADARDGIYRLRHAAAVVEQP